MGAAHLSFDNRNALENKNADVKRPRLVRFRSGLITFHVDSTDSHGQVALIETQGAPGDEPPLHVHRNEDELFYVLEGRLKVVRGSEELTLSPGHSALLPRNVAHTFKIASGYARFLNYITPGGFEAYFRDLGLSVNEN